jgi:protein-tyrosine phosphatase
LAREFTEIWPKARRGHVRWTLNFHKNLIPASLSKMLKTTKIHKRACRMRHVPYFCRMRILMVCLGNICRSPLAEAILLHRSRAAGLDWEVDSAGTNGYHVGETPHPLSQKVARMHGLDISKQRARKFIGDDFQGFDHIYAMAGDVLHEMRLIAGKKYDPARTSLLMHEVDPDKDVDVPDPWSGPESEYHEAYRLMDQACEKIVKRYGQQQSANAKKPAGPQDVPPGSGSKEPQEIPRRQTMGGPHD